MNRIVFYKLACTKFHKTYERPVKPCFSINTLDERYGGDCCIYAVIKDGKVDSVSGMMKHKVRSFGKLYLLKPPILDSKRPLLFKFHAGVPKYICRWDDVLEIVNLQLDSIDSEDFRDALFEAGADGIKKLTKNAIKECRIEPW